MTIATTDSVTPIFAGNDVATSFPFTNFKVTVNTDLEVYYVDAAGAETLQTEGVGYTLVLNSDQDSSPGGTITYPISGSPLATGDKLYGKRAVQNIQSMDLANQSKYNPEVVEDSADKAVQQIQQLKDELSRAVKVTIGSEDDPDALIASIETSESNAATSAAAASTSESNAATSESNAADSETAAAISAATSADIATTVSGTDTYTATLGVSGYTLDKTYFLSFTNTNTVTNPTLKFDAHATLNMKNLDGSSIPIGAIPAEALVRYDGTDILLLTPIINFASSAEVAAGTNSEKVISPATQGNHLTAAKAWVNFNGTGTVAIRDSFNVSSITDDGVGITTINFTNNMPDVNYAVYVNALSTNSSSSNTAGLRSTDNINAASKLVGSAQILTTAAGVDADQDEVSMHVLSS